MKPAHIFSSFYRAARRLGLSSKVVDEYLKNDGTAAAEGKSIVIVYTDMHNTDHVVYGHAGQAHGKCAADWAERFNRKSAGLRCPQPRTERPASTASPWQ